MSYANGTPFINLPQTVGTDKRDWFDCNEAFLDLDTKMKAAYEGAIDTAASLAALAEVVSGISSDVESLQGTVGEHTTSIGTINEALTLINSALVSLNSSVSGKFDSAGIADPYDAEHGTYDVSDVVTYNGQRYECVTAVTAAEPFDADKWNAVDIQTKLDQIDTSLSGKVGTVSTDEYFRSGSWSGADGISLPKGVVHVLFKSTDGTEATFSVNGTNIGFTSDTNGINFTFAIASSTLIGTDSKGVCQWTWTPSL